MELPNYFEKFLREIRPTQPQKDDLIQGHNTLRTRLREHDKFKDLIVTTFLQGSYRRFTLVRPVGEELADVDVVVATNINTDEYTEPDKAMDLFVPFLREHYSGKYRRQGRSFGISLSYVSLDLVIVSVPSLAAVEILKSEAVSCNDTLEEAKDWRLVPSWIPESQRHHPNGQTMVVKAREEQEWKADPILIPDREVGKWVQTNPIEQMKWTHAKNARCNGYYLGVVKALKWWQRVNPDVPSSPSGYPLEHIVGYCCPDWISSVGEGIVRSLEGFVSSFHSNVLLHSVPELPDHGVPGSNVLKRVTPSEFSALFESIENAAVVARNAIDADTVKKSADLWRQLFGEKFPPSGDNGDNGSDDPKGPFIIPNKRKPTGDTGPSKYA